MRTDTNLRRLAIAGLALVLYLILSLIYFGTTGDYSRMYLGLGNDPTAYIWFLNWWPWAVAHGQNPFVSYYVWYPHGFNMTWAGSMPSGALLMSPVTCLTNAVVSFNVLSLVAPAISAWAAFLLVRYLTRDAPSSFIGGYLFGFSSYELGRMLGHLNLSVIFIVPLLVLFVVQRVRGDLSRPRFIAALAIALLVQLGLSTEILATGCVLGGIAWLIFLFFAASEERRRLWMVAGEIIVAGGIMAIVGAPFLFFVLNGLGQIPPQINSPDYYSTDLLNYVVPTVVTRFGSSFFTEMARRFTGNFSEQGAYLGLPLILILSLQFRNFNLRPYLKPILVSLVVMLVLSLGPSLHVAGVDTHLGLPWSLALDLPFIHQALPNRFSMYVALIAGLTVAFWLSEARRGWNRAGRFTLAALACLCLVPNPALIFWTPLPLEPFFEPQNVIAALGPNANVIMLPYGNTGPSMIWQWQSGMGFTQSGGYVGSMPKAESPWQIVKSLTAGIGGPTFENDLSAFCVTHHVSAILVGPGTPDALTAAIDAFHWPETRDHGVRIVRVPDPSLLHFYYVLGDYWPEVEGPENWMGREINVVTHDRPLQLRITGRYRPAKLDPVEITIANGSEVSHYQIGQRDTKLISIPANASVIVKASATFVPEQTILNRDERPLSVEFSLLPSAGSSEAK